MHGKMSASTHSTRTNLLEQAELLFAKKGFYGTSVNDVAKSLNMSKQGVLHHFPTKEKLYAAVLEDAASYLIKHIDESMESLSDPREQLINIYTSFNIEDARLLRVSQLMIRELLDNLKRAETAHHWYLTSLLNKVEKIVKSGQATGAFKPLHPMAFIYQVLGAQQYFLVSLPTLKQIYNDDKAYQSHIANHMAETIRIIESTLFSQQ